MVDQVILEMGAKAMMGGVIIKEIIVKNALTRSGLPEYDYALNPYLGCQHGCVYCYAMEFTRGEPGINWGGVVYVKANLVQVLSREVRRFRPGIVGLSTITDPYQPVESRYRLTRRSIEVLCNAGFHVSIQTKSALIIRDLDLLRRCSGSVDVGFTITTMRDTYRLIEPMAAHPLARASALRRISELGIETWVFLGPIIPGINDRREDYEPIIRLARDTGSQLIIDRFRPRPLVIKVMSDRLGHVNTPSRSWWSVVLKDVLALCREYGVECMSAEDEWGMARGRKR